MSDEDIIALNEYRQKRMAELQRAAAKNKFGYLVQLSRDEYVRQVTDASQEYPVVVFLYKEKYLFYLHVAFATLTTLSLIVRF